MHAADGLPGWTGSAQALFETSTAQLTEAFASGSLSASGAAGQAVELMASDGNALQVC